MSRIIILGGRGFFGAAAADLLRRDGEQPLIASRRPGGDLLVDAENRDSLRAALRARDVVIDAAGPFQKRSTAVIEAALGTGCDVIDLSDSLGYRLRVQRLAPRIGGGGIRVLPSCSSVSAVSAALVQLLDVSRPVRVSAFLAPATRNTSTIATSQSLMSSLARPIRVLRAGQLVEARAFGEHRRIDLADPVGSIQAWLNESADAVALPLAWPSLRDVDFWVDTRRRLLNRAIAASARHRSLRLLLQALQPVGRTMTKRFGARSGGFAVDVEDAAGARGRAGFVHGSHSYIVAVAPAVLAARSIVAGRFTSSGLVPADRLVDPGALVDYLARAGVRYFRSER